MEQNSLSASLSASLPARLLACLFHCLFVCLLVCLLVCLFGSSALLSLAPRRLMCFSSAGRSGFNVSCPAWTCCRLRRSPSVYRLPSVCLASVCLSLFPSLLPCPLSPFRRLPLPLPFVSLSLSPVPCLRLVHVPTAEDRISPVPGPRFRPVPTIVGWASANRRPAAPYTHPPAVTIPDTR